jgi:hypothetical protein
MELLFEALIQIIGEFVLQILFQALAELGFHSLKDTLKKESRNPILSTIGFFLWGAMAGGISLLIFPHSFVASKSVRLLNLAVTPLACGEVMRQVGKLRERRGQSLVGLDRFFYAFAFALAMSLIRYFFAKAPSETILIP